MTDDDGPQDDSDDTASIDLDAMEVKSDEPEGNYGDWIWRNDTDPDDEPESGWKPSQTPASTTEADSTDPEDLLGDDGGLTDDASSPDGRYAPGVPSSGGPVGVPEEQGGAGGASPGGTRETDNVEGAGTAETHNATEPSDMTTAYTFKAMHYFEDPGLVIAETEGWSDWIGIVGEVSTPVIRKFQRENRIDLDFFGGSENGPDARLADIDEESMFYAERMVLVGVEGDDEWIAEAAGWEFVPLQQAAKKADWELKSDLID
ncbi:MAG: hypothetical protein PPP58_03500 [Natronomonas sp.]